MSVKTLVIIALVSVTSAFGLGLGNLTISTQAGEYYTRKRVNGVWMTGRFSRHHAIRTAQLETKTPSPPAEPLSTTVPTGTIANDDLAPAFQRAFQARRAGGAAVAAVAAAASIASKAATPVPTTSASVPAAVSLTENERLLPLRKALEARAKVMAVSTTSSSRNIKAVTFNFETGLRTSVYTDGSVVEERFEPDTTLTGSIKY